MGYIANGMRSHEISLWSGKYQRLLQCLIKLMNGEKIRFNQIPYNNVMEKLEILTNEEGFAKINVDKLKSNSMIVDDDLFDKMTDIDWMREQRYKLGLRKEKPDRKRKAEELRKRRATHKKLLEEHEMNKTKWRIIIKSGIQSKSKEYESKEGETPQDTYKRVKKVISDLENKYGDKIKVYLVSLTLHFKPRGEREKGRYWCPYCMGWRIFKYDDSLGVKKCIVCGISDSDYYVRKYNELWVAKKGKK